MALHVQFHRLTVLLKVVLQWGIIQTFITNIFQITRLLGNKEKLLIRRMTEINIKKESHLHCINLYNATTVNISETKERGGDFIN